MNCKRRAGHSTSGFKPRSGTWPHRERQLALIHAVIDQRYQAVVAVTSEGRAVIGVATFWTGVLHRGRLLAMVGSDRELRLNLPDGRQLEALADGPADGLPLLFHYGTPCGAVRYGPLVEAAARRKLRTIVYSRPGYGTSTAKHGRSIADAVKDVEAILGELGADEFVTIGWSGGGPHALACAAVLPDRCAAAVSLAGVAPYGVDWLGWMAGMASGNIKED